MYNRQVFYDKYQTGISGITTATDSSVIPVASSSQVTLEIEIVNATAAALTLTFSLVSMRDGNTTKYYLTASDFGVPAAGVVSETLNRRLITVVTPAAAATYGYDYPLPLVSDRLILEDVTLSGGGAGDYVNIAARVSYNDR